MTATEMLVHLQLTGQQQKAEKLSALIIERFEEDLQFDDPAIKYNGKCGRCGHVFQEGDCQHDGVKNIVACDACYLWFHQPITMADLED